MGKKDHASNGMDWCIGTVPWPKTLDHKLETLTTSNKNVLGHVGTLTQQKESIKDGNQNPVVDWHACTIPCKISEDHIKGGVNSGMPRSLQRSW